MKTLVLGLGNPILSDDGVGIRVVHEVEKNLSDPQVAVSGTSAAGLSLLDCILGYDKVIIIDAIQTKEGKAGWVYRMKPEDFSFAKGLSSPHQINLVTALELGKMLSLAVPKEITVFAIEAKDITTFSEKCTPDVEKAVPEVAKMVLEDLIG
jgi:hydrogenase maturation protease